MRLRNWDDLRFLLAVGRGDTLAAAAKRLGVDNTTVSRRLAAAQSSLGAQLVHRLPNGKLRLTAAGEAAVARAVRVEREVGTLCAAIGGADTDIHGSVRLTSVPILVNRLLAPASDGLLRDHPSLGLELVADARDLSLTKREADLALRLARPSQGGTRVVARRIGALAYAAYAARGLSPAAVLPWVAYEESMAHLPQAAWMERRAREAGERLSGLRVGDAESALEAIAAGGGRSVLPRLVADRDPRLARIEVTGSAGPPDRELWLLVHADLAALPRVAVVSRWLERLVSPIVG